MMKMMTTAGTGPPHELRTDSYWPAQSRFVSCRAWKQTLSVAVRWSLRRQSTMVREQVNDGPWAGRRWSASRSTMVREQVSNGPWAGRRRSV